ncbi:MAG TPA: bacillithiol biosynthesis cysteine-adding enzyme BshC [Bryobacteraceae bacterium]|nr:bacillithiol biosynthesis cysteine-adding enzyme BshC [Bryobacteraceae bacterium]
MECSCVRHTDVPGASRLFVDLIYHFDRVQDLYTCPPNDVPALAKASRFDFPDDRRAALIQALTPLNQGNPSLALLAKPGAVAIVTGQQTGLFSGPAYSVYKALTAIKLARELSAAGIPAVPVFWAATEDHDFAEVDHAWVFGADCQPVKIQARGTAETGSKPVGWIAPGELPLGELRSALADQPFAADAIAMVERAWKPGETMGSAFTGFLQEVFRSYGLLVVDPLEPLLRKIAAPLLSEAVERMPELVEALIARSKELVERGYHAQVLVEKTTSLMFLLEGGERIGLRRSNGGFSSVSRKFTVAELAARGPELSPNALLLPVIQDYLLPTAAYIGGPAELAYLAQSQVLYRKLLGRQPAAFPRAFFTLVDRRSQKRMLRYGLGPTDLFGGEEVLRDRIAARLVPEKIRTRLDETTAAVSNALNGLKADLDGFDPSLAEALATSRRKIEYQAGKIARKTARQILIRDEQAVRDAHALSGLVFPGKHLQERIYSIVPFLAAFGPGLVDDLYAAVRLECPDHQFVVV